MCVYVYERALLYTFLTKSAHHGCRRLLTGPCE